MKLKKITPRSALLNAIHIFKYISFVGMDFGGDKL